MVIEPQQGLTDQLVALLPEAFEREKQWRMAEGRPMSLGDQGVVNMFWPEWLQQSNLHLDAKYNVMATHLDYYVADLGYRLRGPDAIRVLHFDGEVKPWMMKGGAFYRRTAGLLRRRRVWEVAAILAFKAVRHSARLRLALRRSSLD
jgi:lipopolysaccharide biosynthesis glycosyltransferase